MKEVDQEHTEQIMESSAMPEAVEEDSDMAKLVADGILEETKSAPKKRGRPRGSANA